MKIAELSVKNPVFANLLLLVLLVGGIMTYRSMTREVFPEIPLDMIVITTEYIGATPEEVEKQITIPIENALEGIEDIESTSSQSYENISVIEIKVEQGTKDLQKMVNDIKTEIEKIEHYPEEAEQPRVIEIKSEIPVIGVSIAGQAEERVRRKVAEELKERIMFIKGVSRIQVNGLRDPEIWVKIDPLRLDGLGISIDKVAEAIGSANVNLPAGLITGKSQEFPLRTSHELENAEDVGRVPIARDASGRDIVVSDIAQVVETFEKKRDFGRINGEEAITLYVLKTRAANTIEVVDNVKKLLSDFNREVPEGLTVATFQNSSRYIRERLKTLYTSGSIGLLLVCLVLFVFLNWKMAFWTALGIPTSFAGAFLIMDYFGITVNMMSLFSLILVLGMVVDDAIIVTENVYRYLQAGYSSGKAAVMGASEVLGPVTAATTTTIAAFMPLLMMSGIMGKFLSTIPIVVTITLLVSFVEAFIILPSHLADFAKPAGGKVKKDSGWYRLSKRIYRKTIKSALRYRYPVLAGALAIMVFTAFYSAYYQKFVLFHSKDLVGFVVRLELPVGSSLENSGNILKKVEEAGKGLPKEDVETMVSMVGMRLDYDTGRISYGSHFAQVLFESTEFDTPGRRNGFVVADEMREKLKTLTGARSVEVRKLGGGPPVGHALEARISGKDYVMLTAAARDMQDFTKASPGVVDVKDDYSPGKNEIHITPDSERMLLFNMSDAMIARAIRTYFDGRIASTIKRGKDDIDIRIKYAEPYADDIDFIRQVNVTNQKGKKIRLTTVAEMSWQKGFSTINHFNGKRTIKVMAEVETDKITSTELTALVQKYWDGTSFRYPGYSLDFGGEAEEQKESVDSLMRAGVLGLMIIYLILGTLFKSFLQPIVVLSAIPFAFVGVIFGHWVMDEPIGILSLIGLVALTGIVVNDSLVMVDFINRSRLRGAPRWLSILRSAFVRFRPVILTSLTTILGLSTLAFKTSGQAAFLSPMAISIVFGLFFSTILTLMVIPCIYAVLDDAMARFFGRAGLVSRVEDM